MAISMLYAYMYPMDLYIYLSTKSICIRIYLDILPCLPCPALLRYGPLIGLSEPKQQLQTPGLDCTYSTNSHRQCSNNAEIQRSCSSVKRCRTALFTSQSLLIHYAAMARDPIPPFPLLFLKCPGGAFRYWRPSLPVPGLSVLQDSAS